MAKETEKTPGTTVNHAQPATPKGKPPSPGAGQAGVKIGQAATPKGGKTK